jgi:hypothetical protein
LRRLGSARALNSKSVSSRRPAMNGYMQVICCMNYRQAITCMSSTG